MLYQLNAVHGFHLMLVHSSTRSREFQYCHWREMLISNCSIQRDQI